MLSHRDSIQRTLEELAPRALVPSSREVRYHGDYPQEADERIRRNREEAEAAEAAWRRERAALA